LHTLSIFSPYPSYVVFRGYYRAKLLIFASPVYYIFSSPVVFVVPFEVVELIRGLQMEQRKLQEMKKCNKPVKQISTIWRDNSPEKQHKKDKEKI
jgi:hypothetical protein